MDRDAVRSEAGGLRSMGQVLGWAESRRPRVAFVNAVTQDEFTIDVVVRAADDVYLVFDTT